MKKLLFSFCTILALSLVSCGGNTKTQHEIIIKEETEQEKNTDWIEYGLVNSFDCFKHNSERYYYSAKSSEMLIWYRYVNGEIQYSANGYGTKRLVRNPYTTIKVKNPNTGDTTTHNVSHYVWCYEGTNSSRSWCYFLPEL